jgi:hypothetical protein
LPPGCQVDTGEQLVQAPFPAAVGSQNSTGHTTSLVDTGVEIGLSTLVAVFGATAAVKGACATGLLFRPFAGSRHAQVAGQRLSRLDLAAHEELLRRLVDEMDRRILKQPARRSPGRSSGSGRAGVWPVPPGGRCA